jgi:hypothetical protein
MIDLSSPQLGPVCKVSGNQAAQLVSATIVNAGDGGKTFVK